MLGAFFSFMSQRMRRPEGTVVGILTVFCSSLVKKLPELRDKLQSVRAEHDYEF